MSSALTCLLQMFQASNHQQAYRSLHVPAVALAAGKKGCLKELHARTEQTAVGKCRPGLQVNYCSLFCKPGNDTCWLAGWTGKYESVPRLLDLVRHAESDAWLALGLAFYLNVLPLSRQLSCLSGALWSRVLQVKLCLAHSEEQCLPGQAKGPASRPVLNSLNA